MFLLHGTKEKDKKYSKITTYFISALKGFIVFLIGLLILSLLILKKSSDSQVLYLFSFLIMALGGFISGLSAFKNLRGRGFINGITAAAIYLGLLIITVVCLMRLNISGNILLTVPVCLIAGFLGGTIGANT